MKECPCHVDSDSMPSKEIIGKIIMYNGTTSGLEVESSRHTTPWMPQPCHHDHGVAHSVHCISYTKMSWSNLWWSITQSFLPQICIVLEAMLRPLKFKFHTLCVRLMHLWIISCSHTWTLTKLQFSLQLNASRWFIVASSQSRHASW